MRYVIAYDIADDGDRARVAARLAAWGDRIQLSVFECTLSSDELDDLEQVIMERIDPINDSVHFLPICASCDGSRRLLGQATRVEKELWWIV